MKYALVSDFDGTITFDDFFDYAINQFLDSNALEPWRQYVAGNKTHFNALKEIFEKIKVDEDVLNSFIKTIKVDKEFYKTFELCKEKNIPVFVVSAGCDYYIKIILGDLLNEIRLITNSATYSKQAGLVMKPQPKESPYYDANVGVDKRAVVKELKDRGYCVIFAGDGAPDVEPAKIADFVFARKFLLKKCRELTIFTQIFDTYKDIYNFILELNDGCKQTN